MRAVTSCSPKQCIAESVSGGLQSYGELSGLATRCSIRGGSPRNPALSYTSQYYLAGPIHSSTSFFRRSTREVDPAERRNALQNSDQAVSISYRIIVWGAALGVEARFLLMCDFIDFMTLAFDMGMNIFAGYLTKQVFDLLCHITMRMKKLFS